LQLAEIVKSDGFPAKFIGKDVVFKRITGVFDGYSTDRRKFVIVDAETHERRQISIEKMFPGWTEPVCRTATSARPAAPATRSALPVVPAPDEDSLVFLATDPRFPQNVVGREVEYLERAYHILKVTSDGTKLVAKLEGADGTKAISIEDLKRKARSLAARA
jgi:hypothetical protein